MTLGILYIASKCGGVCVFRLPSLDLQLQLDMVELDPSIREILEPSLAQAFGCIKNEAQNFRVEGSISRREVCSAKSGPGTRIYGLLIP